MSDRQQLNGSRDPHLLEFCLCVTPSLWVWAGPRVSRLTEYGKNDEMSLLRWGYKKTVASFLGKDLALSTGLLWEKLPATWDMSYGQEQKGAFNQLPANDKSPWRPLLPRPRESRHSWLPQFQEPLWARCVQVPDAQQLWDNKRSLF